MSYDLEKLELAKARYRALIEETEISLTMLEILEQLDEPITGVEMLDKLTERGAITKKMPSAQLLAQLKIADDVLFELTDELLDYAIAGESL